MVAHPKGVELSAMPGNQSRLIGWLFAGTGVTLFALMMLMGVLMRLDQSGTLEIPDDWFYRIMTLHGAGMLVGTLLAMMGGLWFVAASTLRMSFGRMLWSYGTIVGGTVAVLIAVMVGGFAAAWTFLTPLPFSAAGQWDTWATLTFLVGMLLVGVGFMIFCIDAVASTTAKYGTLQRAIGLSYLRGKDDNPPTPPALATIVVGIQGLLASAAGATIVLALITRVFDGAQTIDPLWGKNFTYFFGHSVANLIIYLGAGMIYVLVPRYAGRPWKTSKPLVWGWMGTLVFVTFAYSHHLYMDFVQPEFAGIVAMVASAGAAIPVAVVTIFTAMMLIWGSQFRWTMASTMLFIGFSGWAIGGVGAVIDALIPVNVIFHNTLWVPAHFHTYLLLGVGMWMFAFVTHLFERNAGRPSARWAAVGAPALMVVGGYGLVSAWYISGSLGVARRYSEHPESAQGLSLWGSIFAIVFLAGFFVMVAEWLRLWRSSRGRPAEATEAESQVTGNGQASGSGHAVTETGLETLAVAGGPEFSAIGLLRTPRQLMFAVAFATAAMVSFLPSVIEASETDAAIHHLTHAGHFFVGGMFAIALANTSLYSRMLRISAPGVAIAAAILLPAVMLLLMTPGIYSSLAGNSLGHFAYHFGILMLGAIAGVSCNRLGPVAGWIVFAIGVAMAVSFAAGVGTG